MTENPHIIHEAELEAMTGYRSRGALARHLRLSGVRFHRGRNGAIWTTLEAINESLGVAAKSKEPDLDFA